MPISYQQIIRQLESRSVMPESIPSLAPMRKALARIFPTEPDRPNQPNKKNAFRPDRTIVVAGTNGKGSVCATLETLFLAAGETVGLYTSPHLQHTTERIRLNGQSISEKLFCVAYKKIESLTQDISLTHFEVLTLMAAWVFFSEGAHVDRPLDRIIFEVGLGGIWDATNAIPHLHCVIASIGFDHENLLGNTLTSIAKNKFGIIGPDCLVVHSPFPDEILPLVAEVQKQNRRGLIPSIPFQMWVEMRGREPEFWIHTQWGETPLSLPGGRAAQNTATALTLFHALGFNPTPYLKNIAKMHWPGRMEKISLPKSPCSIYLSGDHNPQGIQSLLDLLPYYPRRHLHILLGVGREKNLDGMLNPLFALKNTSVYFTESPFHGRRLSSDPAGYGQWLKLAAGSSASPDQALDQILVKATSEDLIVVTGSLYLVGFVKTLIQSRK